MEDKKPELDKVNRKNLVMMYMIKALYDITDELLEESVGAINVEIQEKLQALVQKDLSEALITVVNGYNNSQLN